jgi:DNA-binding NtrC family response regulator
LAQLLEGEGYAVRSFANTDEALVGGMADPPDILIADWCVPGALSSVDLMESLRRMNPKLKVVFISGYESRELRDLVDSHSGVECFSKPIHFDRFLRDIKTHSWPQAI